MTTQDGVLAARAVHVPASDSAHGLDLLPRTSLDVAAGQIVVLTGDPGPAHVLLALALAGRLDGVAGQVTLGGSDDRAGLQRAVALVDVPGVNEPAPGIPVHTIIGEELAMAGHSAGRTAVRQRLAEFGLAHGTTFVRLSAAQRIGLMLSLAMLRTPRFAVLPLPERLGGLPEDWLPALTRISDAGAGVIVTASRGYAPHFSLGTLLEIGNAVDGRDADVQDTAPDEQDPPDHQEPVSRQDAAGDQTSTHDHPGSDVVTEEKS